MSKVLMSLVFSAFILTGVSYAQTPPPAAAPVAPVAAEPVKSTVHHPEHHSELNKAIRKLKGAKEDLEKAAKDFGGHKAKAIEAINTALEELRAAKELDKK